MIISELPHVEEFSRIDGIKLWGRGIYWRIRYIIYRTWAFEFEQSTCAAYDAFNDPEWEKGRRMQGNV